VIAANAASHGGGKWKQMDGRWTESPTASSAAPDPAPKEYSVLWHPQPQRRLSSPMPLPRWVGGSAMGTGEANIGDHACIFEANHGTARQTLRASIDQSRSVILSGVMMLEVIGLGRRPPT